MRYGFLDESGDVEYTGIGSSNLVVVVVVVGYPERLRKALTKTRKSLGKQMRDIPEFHATDSDPRIVQRLLEHAVKIGFEAVAVILDKNIVPVPADPEDLYREACAQVTCEALKRFGNLSLTLDRRYTKRALRNQLDQLIFERVEGIGAFLGLHHEDSMRENLLQIADHVAWAVLQRYERGDDSFWELIKGSITEMRYTGQTK